MHDDSALVERRIRRELNERLMPAMYSASTPMTVEAWDAPGEPVSYREAMAGLQGDGRPFAIGGQWSRPWGTTWFRFTADVAPVTGQVMLGLFKPATGSQPQVILGDAVVPDATVCIGDFNRDGGFDGADVVAFFQAWEAGASAADANNDGGVDGADAQAFYQAWENSSC